MGRYADAVQNISGQKCRILWVGDSLFEGQGASGWNQRPPVLLQGALETRYAVSMDSVPPIHRFYNGGLGSEAWGTMGTVSDEPSVTLDPNYSMSKRGMIINPGHYWIAPTSHYAFRYVEVTFAEATSLGLDDFLLVDLNGPVTLATVDNNSADGGTGKRFIYDYGSVAVREVGVNPWTVPTPIESLSFHVTHPDDGVGFATSDSTVAGLGSNGALPGTGMSLGWAHANADLVLDDLWHNDFVSGECTPEVSAERFADRVTRYRALYGNDVDVVLVMLWNVPFLRDFTVNGNGHTLTQFRTAMRAEATDLGVHIFDLDEYDSEPSSALFTADNVHHNNDGYYAWLGLLDEFLHNTLVSPPSPTVDFRIGTTQVGAMTLGYGTVTGIYVGDDKLL